MSRKPKAHEELPPVVAPTVAAVEPGSETAARTPPLRARHYQQRFDDVTDFVWAKHCTAFGKPVKPGDPVDRAKFRIDKLRRLWVARFIQAKDWDLATARRTRGTRRRRIA